MKHPDRACLGWPGQIVNENIFRVIRLTHHIHLYLQPAEHNLVGTLPAEESYPLHPLNLNIIFTSVSSCKAVSSGTVKTVPQKKNHP